MDYWVHSLYPEQMLKKCLKQQERGDINLLLIAQLKQITLQWSPWIRWTHQFLSFSLFCSWSAVQTQQGESSPTLVQGPWRVKLFTTSTSFVSRSVIKSCPTSHVLLLNVWMRVGREVGDMQSVGDLCVSLCGAEKKQKSLHHSLVCLCCASRFDWSVLLFWKKKSLTIRISSQTELRHI